MNLSYTEVLAAINVGLHLHQTQISPSNISYGAESYLASGHCKLEVDRGMENHRDLSDEAHAVIEEIIKLVTYQKGDAGSSFEIKGSIFTVEAVDDGRKVVVNGRDLIVVKGIGGDALFTVDLADGFTLEGECMLTHARVDGEMRYLLKMWSPFQLMRAVIAMTANGCWGYQL